MGTTGLLIAGGILVVVLGAWAIGRISRKRGEERVGGRILSDQQKAAEERRTARRKRRRLRGAALRKRMRELAGRG